MSDAREAILKNLEEGRLRVIPESPPGGWLPVDPVRDTGAEALESRFIAEAQAAGVRVLSPSDREAAFGLLNNILVEERVVLGWSPKHIPLKGFQEWLSGKGITLLEEPDSSPKVGITGADAVLSTTGSLILTPGRENHGRLHCSRKLTWLWSSGRQSPPTSKAGWWPGVNREWKGCVCPLTWWSSLAPAGPPTSAWSWSWAHMGLAI